VAYEAIQRFFPYEGRVVKRISKRRVRNPKSLLSEIHIMGRLDHPHIVKLYDTYEDTESLCLVMEYPLRNIVTAVGVNFTNG
jgi:calcium-dependent protein kinase